MADSRIAGSRYAAQWLGVLVGLSSLTGCGDGPTTPVLTGPGFVVSVSIPGLMDTIIQGDSTNWRMLYGSTPEGGLDQKDLSLRFWVVDPPAPLESPLIFEVRWYRLQPALPGEQSYPLGVDFPPSVNFTAQSNVGLWGAVNGQVRLTEVADTSISGEVSATLVQFYPEDPKYLPDARVRAQFWTPVAIDP
jgi:hypothetical protein